MFKDIQPILNLPDLEKEILRYWEENDIFGKVDKNSKTEHPVSKVYYDGPMTANAMPHHGHVITWTMKDVVPRYWTMTGNYVSRNMGWDCQGIPVEYEIEKRMGFKSKSEIKDFGIEKFNKLCRESVLEFREVMRTYEKRIGRWMDEQNDSYETMAPSYIESVWWSIQELYKKGLLYEGHKVVAYSTRAGTSLSNAEVALGGYKEIIDPAVTVKFKLEGRDNTFLLAWTTTPWTLPGNLLLSVGKNIEYVEVAFNGENYILAKKALDRVFMDKSGYRIVKEYKSEELIGLTYEPLFDYYSKKKVEGLFKVIYADHVNTGEGTGIVHLAPYGAEDFDIFMSMGVKLFDYLDEEAKFTEDIPELEGKFYKTANSEIIGMLKKKDLLFHHEDYAHQMPMCWRTDTPLIYKPLKSWYLAVTKMKDLLISENNKVKWVPEHIKNGRFGDCLNNARDWALSRSRYWGTPLPIWVNDKTGEVEMIGSFKELEEKSGQTLGENFDPHMPFVDDIKWDGANGGVFRRIPDVLDVWYDSGSMPFAQYHYPFENKELFDKRFPADYISEGPDQTRGWFYSLMVINVALFGKTPYKTVVVTGLLGDEYGKKLSKSKKNYPPVEEVFEKYGTEAMRYFLLSSPVVRCGTARLSYKLLDESKREIFPTLWNSYRYFVTYANLNNFRFDPKEAENPQNILDIWILNRLEEIKGNIRGYMDEYEIMYAVREFYGFIDDLSNWYIRRSRERISAGDNTALNVLFEVLYTLSKLLAPFLPLLSESIYQNLSQVDANRRLSVHMESYPVAKELVVDKEMIEKMSKIKQIASQASSIRKENNLAVKQPLRNLYVLSTAKIEESYLDILKQEVNVKEVVFVNGLPTANIITNVGQFTIGLDTEIDEELELERIYREIVREIQKIRKSEDLAWNQTVAIEYPANENTKKAVMKYSEEIKSKTFVSELIEGKEYKIVK